jgi:hypothetical protein
MRVSVKNTKCLVNKIISSDTAVKLQKKNNFLKQWCLSDFCAFTLSETFTQS